LLTTLILVSRALRAAADDALPQFSVPLTASFASGNELTLRYVETIAHAARTPADAAASFVADAAAAHGPDTELGAALRDGETAAEFVHVLGERLARVRANRADSDAAAAARATAADIARLSARRAVACAGSAAAARVPAVARDPPGPAWAAPGGGDGGGDAYDGMLRAVRDKASLPQLVSDLALTGIGVELGVAEGDFSLALLRGTALAELHLVDLFEPLAGDPSWWVREAKEAAAAAAASGGGGAAAAAAPSSPVDALRARLEAEAGAAAAARAVVVRSLTADAAARFSDGTLDFVYVDASHDYASVRADLRAWWRKLRPGGLMAGNDYHTGYVPAARAVFGVADAVDEFFAMRRVRVLKTVSYDPERDMAPDWYALKCGGDDDAASYCSSES